MRWVSARGCSGATGGAAALDAHEAAAGALHLDAAAHAERRVAGAHPWRLVGRHDMAGMLLEAVPLMIVRMNSSVLDPGEVMPIFRP